MCHIAWRRKCQTVQLETNPDATKLLFVLFKPVHFCALVSSSIPGDVSHSNYLIWPLAKLRMRFSQSQMYSYLSFTLHGCSPVGKASILPPFPLVLSPLSPILGSQLIAHKVIMTHELCYIWRFLLLIQHSPHPRGSGKQDGVQSKECRHLGLRGFRRVSWLYGVPRNSFKFL